VQDDGWTRLRRGHVKRTGRAGCLTFAATALLCIGAFVVLGALRVHPLLNFLILCAVLIFGGLAVSAVADLLWGTGARVYASRQPVRAGQTFTIRCTISRPRNAQGLRVMWQGREEAVLRGYDTTRFAEAFLRQQLAGAIGGTMSIEVPPDAMPSFSGKNARIIWSVSVEAQGSGGPNEADFPILVLPGRS
jgi:hypothetical protein